MTVNGNSKGDYVASVEDVTNFSANRSGFIAYVENCVELVGGDKKRTYWFEDEDGDFVKAYLTYEGMLEAIKVYGSDSIDRATEAMNTLLEVVYDETRKA